MSNNCSKSDHFKHTKGITEVELWGVVETGWENVNNNVITDGFTYFDSTEYYIYAFANPVDQTNSNE